MSDRAVTPEERYASIVAQFLDRSAATYAADTGRSTRKFGANALKIDNKIFAMLVRGRLVVKLPRRRVDELIASGQGERFDPGHGRLMKEWLSLEPGSEDSWACLAGGAMEFVGARSS